MRSEAPTPAQNSWRRVQHHLHGHCGRSGSTLEDPAAGSSPRCQICACFFRAAAPANRFPELQAASRHSLSLSGSGKR